MENRQVDVPESHFKDLLKYWNSDPHKKMSETKTENRNKLKCPYTAGRTSFDLIREAEMERIQSTQESEDGSHSFDAFASVMGLEHPGRVRLCERGVTKTVLKGKIWNLGSSLDATDERMQQKMEEMEERMRQRMQEKLNEQKDAMEQDIIMNVIARLQRLNPELRLDPDMLRFSARSPVSAQQAVVQLNNQPSASSNNQGGVDQEMEDEGSEELYLT